MLTTNKEIYAEAYDIYLKENFFLCRTQNLFGKVFGEETIEYAPMAMLNNSQITLQIGVPEGGTRVPRVLHADFKPIRFQPKPLSKIKVRDGVTFEL
jgi:hypothetical protein